jgi:hypothetical protein
MLTKGSGGKLVTSGAPYIQKEGYLMRKSRLRRPSPALVVAFVALFAAAGGGAYASSTSDTKSDKKIANKAAKTYFNKHIAGASVSHANTAGSATDATKP